MKINQKHIEIIIAVLLWLLLIIDNHFSAFWVDFVESSLRVALLVVAFKVFKYHYPAIKQNKMARVRLFIWFAILSAAMTSIDHFIAMILPESELEYLKKLVELEAVYNTYFEPATYDSILSLIFSTLTIAAAMTFSWTLLLFQTNRENELDISNLKATNKESELAQLKNQLNPHFLFNALSNIYSIAYMGNKETPNKIMELSKMLRYVIYDTDVDFISLSKEIEYLKNYIEFQKFKTKRIQQIDFDYSECDEHRKIAPLLLLPFVENAFKHSQVFIEKAAWVRIKLSTNKDAIEFVIENSISNRVKPEILGSGGAGMENTRKRLKLLYADTHELSILNNETYLVHLKIATK